MRCCISAWVLLATGAARADGVDVSPVLPRMKLLSDGAGHYLAFTPPPDATDDEAKLRLFYSTDGKTFFQAYTTGRGSMKGGHEYYFWEPREEGKTALLESGGKYTLDCGDRDVPFSEVDASPLQAAAFKPYRFMREPVVLARDDRGTYFYVDKAWFADKDHRVYSGPKGKLKLLKLKNIVSDSRGKIFSTKHGELRLVVNAQGDEVDLFWIKGKRRKQLTEVPYRENTLLIFNELGVYAGKPLGTPCDDL